ncbi:hypothetical protein [uncultured Algimonas sp.]|uniref:hypothetical protein n=1 Tax=uncultured Algimonas sp. TaxID=1547920 RepID=UPI00260337BA|nr:hypothetical protein [uncultured Algimonas sp.]
MNIIATTLLAGTIAILPAGLVPKPDIANPIDGVSVCVAGMQIGLDADGLETKAANTTDFTLELRLKSAAPIRVRL